MISGDGNQDGMITSRDYVAWYHARHINAGGYLPADYNGDNLIDELDFTLWKSNAQAGRQSKLP